MKDEKNSQEQKDNGKVITPPKLTEAELRSFKGRPPAAVADQVKALRPPKKPQRLITEEMINIFTEAYIKNGGNATQAALKVAPYKNPNDAGSTYLKKSRDLGRLILQQQGYNYPQFLEALAKKALDPNVKDPAWMDRILKIMGFYNGTEVQPIQQTVNVMNVHRELLGEYVEGSFESELPDEEDLDDSKD